MSNDYKSLSHCRYLLQYHLVWCPKFRFEVIQGDIEQSLKNILANVCNKYQYEILELEVMTDHIHIFLSAKPTVAPTDIVRTLKSISAIKLFKEYPKLKKFYACCGSLWSKGYFVSTIENVSFHTIKRYIQNQKSN
ncbi:IS200/IS605 family transposase [Natroniella acetigena]|uniref:IS200/IS605 family transposase n=1 Tax=Natroniella acetigena TaxID=52004 RepID=UPI00200B8693|nr:IS200/IS605 family transposase [Natroniella acetigena]MCK8827433.1 IS200/IS605 family transposase [Natroniella acetigena]